MVKCMDSLCVPKACLNEVVIHIWMKYKWHFQYSRSLRFLLLLNAAMFEIYLLSLHLQSAPNACHAPFDSLPSYALSMTPSFPLHHLSQIYSATETFQIIHLVTKGRVTNHPQGSESSYHEGHRRKKYICNKSCVVEDEFKCRTNVQIYWHRIEWNIKHLKNPKQKENGKSNVCCQVITWDHPSKKQASFFCQYYLQSKKSNNLEFSVSILYLPIT